ncbi:MAG TPA: phosphomannomutase [Epsilonproteobacteria bacterium]|nr:phosphomannomutase [Campylobacterota bacterium]
MTITIQDQEFDPMDISQLYYAAMVIKENEDEPTQMNLALLDKEGHENIEVLGYGIFIHLVDDEEAYPFLYDTREELDAVSDQIKQQIKQRRNGQ